MQASRTTVRQPFADCSGVRGTGPQGDLVVDVGDLVRHPVCDVGACRCARVGAHDHTAIVLDRHDGRLQGEGAGRRVSIDDESAPRKGSSLAKEEKSERLRFAASLFPSPSYGPGREHASGPMPRRRGKRRCSTYPESRVLDVRAGPGHVARRRRHL